MTEPSEPVTHYWSTIYKLNRFKDPHYIASKILMAKDLMATAPASLGPQPLSSVEISVPYIRHCDPKASNAAPDPDQQDQART
jgi:hypothetical protein